MRRTIYFIILVVVAGHIMFWLGCREDRPLPPSQKGGPIETRLICFRYAGGISDAPFFPYVITQESMPEQKAMRLAGLQNYILPATYFYLSDTDLEDTIVAIKPVAMGCGEATNAEYGDFSVIILGSGSNFVKTIGHEDMCRLLERMPQRVLKNNRGLDEDVNELKQRLNFGAQH